MQSVHITTVFDTTLCDQVWQWFSQCTPVSSTNKADTHHITEILLKVALSTIYPNPWFIGYFNMCKVILVKMVFRVIVRENEPEITLHVLD